MREDVDINCVAAAVEIAPRSKGARPKAIRTIEAMVSKLDHPTEEYYKCCGCLGLSKLWIPPCSSTLKICGLCCSLPFLSIILPAHEDIISEYLQVIC